MTETGMSLGTPHYMSPEQAMGEREITARSDVYALGCVAYEMLVGEPPFTGPTAQAIIARVMTEEPRTLTLQRHTIPPARRGGGAHRRSRSSRPTASPPPRSSRPRSRTRPRRTARTSMQPVAVHQRRRSWLVAGVIGAAALLAGVLIGGRGENPGSVPPDEVVRATVGLGDSAAIRAIGNLRLAMAPSGQRIAFVGSDGLESSLWVRDFGQPAARPLPDTKGAFAPFFSPDGLSIGFFTSEGSRGVMKVISITEGTTRVVLRDSVAPFGGADWGDDGQIYFTHNNRGLARISSSGGAVTVLSRPDSLAGVERT